MTINYGKYLNPEQLEVVMAKEGPLLVIAGAGSGKTRTVTYRVAYLVEQGVDPERILLVTFTNKAAREMLFRVASLSDIEMKRLWGGTFHHIGNRILRAHSKLLGYDNNYTILDGEDSRHLVNASIGELGFNTADKGFPKGDVLRNIISLFMNTNTTIEEIVLKRYPYLIEYTYDILKVAERYSNQKKRLNFMDFDDLLFHWRELLENHAEARNKFCERFQYILVDEYQDASKIQVDIIDILASFYRNVMVVGDDSQSIYSFRGANFQNIIDFPRRYPDVRMFKLESNYRSTPEILHLANASIAHNRKQFPKQLRAVRKSGEMPALISLNDVMHQADFVAKRILELRDEKGLSFNDMSVLYRAHYHSMELQMELTRRGIPFEVRSGLRFFEQAHIKDVVGFLRIIANPFDELSWKRVAQLFSNIGAAIAQRIWGFVSSSRDPFKALDSDDIIVMVPQKARPNLERFREILRKIRSSSIKSFPGDIIRLVIEEYYEEYLQKNYPNFESRMEDLNQLAHYSLQYDSVEDFLHELALLMDVPAQQAVVDTKECESVTLSSIHQAKGLEWGVVFLIWCIEGRFPVSRNLAEEDGEEEERRLFYVATTRAKDELYICCPQSDHRGNLKTVFMRPSRFVNELEPCCYKNWLIRECG